MDRYAITFESDLLASATPHTLEQKSAMMQSLLEDQNNGGDLVVPARRFRVECLGAAE